VALAGRSRLWGWARPETRAWLGGKRVDVGHDAGGEPVRASRRDGSIPGPIEIRGEASGEPRSRRGSLADERPGAMNHGTAGASLFEAMPKASRDSEAAPGLASGRARRTTVQLTRASSRQCRRRAEIPKRRPAWRAAGRDETTVQLARASSRPRRRRAEMAKWLPGRRATERAVPRHGWSVPSQASAALGASVEKLRTALVWPLRAQGAGAQPQYKPSSQPLPVFAAT